MRIRVGMILVTIGILISVGLAEVVAFQLPISRHCELGTSVEGTATVQVGSDDKFIVQINWECSQLYLNGRGNESVTVTTESWRDSTIKKYNSGSFNRLTIAKGKIPKIFIGTKGTFSETKDGKKVGTELWLMISDDNIESDVIGFMVKGADGILAHGAGRVVDGDIKIRFP